MDDVVKAASDWWIERVKISDDRQKQAFCEALYARRAVDRTMTADVGIYDCNAMANGTGWAPLAAWRDILVPYLTDGHKRADGKWSITHSIEVT